MIRRPPRSTLDRSSAASDVYKRQNFNGDTTKNPLKVTFYAKDRCGNSDSTTASFLYRSNSDTFRITEYSCAFTSNTIDTNKYTVNGCDSIVIHQKIKRLSDSTLISLNTCNPNQKLSDTIYLLNSNGCLLYTSPSPRDRTRSRMPSSA